MKTIIKFSQNIFLEDIYDERISVIEGEEYWIRPMLNKEYEGWIMMSGNFMGENRTFRFSPTLSPTCLANLLKNIYV